MADKTIGDYGPVAPLGDDSVLIQRGGVYLRVLISDLLTFLTANTGEVLSGHGAPSANPGVAAAKYTNLDDSTEWYWDSVAVAWVKQG